MGLLAGRRPRCSPVRAITAGQELLVARVADPAQADPLHVGQQDPGVTAVGQIEDPVEVVALELEVTGVVEVAQPPVLPVEHLHDHPGLGVVGPVGDPGRVGQIPGVDLDGEEVALGQVVGQVLDDRPPGVQLVHLEPEQRPQVLHRELEQGPLVAVEVGAERSGQRRPWDRGRGHGGARSSCRASSWSRSSSARRRAAG